MKEFTIFDTELGVALIGIVKEVHLKANETIPEDFLDDIATIADNAEEKLRSRSQSSKLIGEIEGMRDALKLVFGS